jgi:hypothetical protein
MRECDIPQHYRQPFGSAKSSRQSVSISKRKYTKQTETIQYQPREKRINCSNMQKQTLISDYSNESIAGDSVTGPLLVRKLTVL